MAHLKILLRVMVVVMNYCVTNLFLMDNSACIVSSPCTCAGREIFCDGINSTRILSSRLTNIAAGNEPVILHLTNYHLETLPALLFMNLSSLAVTELTLNLQNNSLNGIQTNAFRGIEDKVVSIDLDNNNFTAIPSELAKLSRLQSLSFRNNPISTLSSSVTTLRVIGRSLKTLSLDLNFFSNWPKELNYLQLLSNLTLTNIQLTNLDFDAFDSFRSKLRSLYIKHSRLEKIPSSVCHLEKLSLLEFSHNHYIHLNSTWIDPFSCKSLSNLTSINLEHNNLRYMPKFPPLFNIDDVHLGHNRLSYLVIYSYSNYTNKEKDTSTLILSHNHFKRIPLLAKVLPQLVHLDMQHNDIRSVEMIGYLFGSFGLPSLTHLILNNNPIEYISFGIFQQGFSRLKTLDLGHTKIQVLPDLSIFSQLQYLGLESNPTDCSCKISFLKGWNVTEIQITGNCDNSTLPVKSFLLRKLPDC